MSGNDDRMDRIAEEARAFATLRPHLIQSGRHGYAVVQGGKLFNVFDTWNDAFDSAIKVFGTTTPFLISRIEQDEPAEAPALVLGLIDPKLP